MKESQYQRHDFDGKRNSNLLDKDNMDSFQSMLDVGGKIFDYREDNYGELSSKRDIKNSADQLSRKLRNSKLDADNSANLYHNMSNNSMIESIGTNSDKIMNYSGALNSSEDAIEIAVEDSTTSIRDINKI